MTTNLPGFGEIQSLPKALVEGEDWLMAVMRSPLFGRIWESLDIPNLSSKFPIARQKWEELFIRVVQRTISFRELQTHIDYLTDEAELQTLYCSTTYNPTPQDLEALFQSFPQSTETTQTVTSDQSTSNSPSEAQSQSEPIPALTTAEPSPAPLTAADPAQTIADTPDATPSSDETPEFSDKAHVPSDELVPSDVVKHESSEPSDDTHAPSDVKITTVPSDADQTCAPSEGEQESAPSAVSDVTSPAPDESQSHQSERSDLTLPESSTSSPLETTTPIPPLSVETPSDTSLPSTDPSVAQTEDALARVQLPELPELPQRDNETSELSEPSDSQIQEPPTESQITKLFLRSPDVAILSAISNEIAKFGHVYGVYVHIDLIEECLPLLMPWIKDTDSVLAVSENLRNFKKSIGKCAVGGPPAT